MEIKVTANTRGWDLAAFAVSLRDVFPHNGITSNGDSVTVLVDDAISEANIVAIRTFAEAYNPTPPTPPATVEEAISKGDLTRAIELLHATVDSQAALIAQLQSVGG